MNRKPWIQLIMLGIALLWSSAGASVQAADLPVTMAVVVAGDCEGRGGETIEASPGQTFKVELFAAGGTGYSWTLENKQLALMEALGDEAGPVDPTANLVGGRTKWTFFLKLKEDAVGQETLNFALKRGWEKNVVPIRAFALTVTAK